MTHTVSLAWLHEMFDQLWGLLEALCAVRHPLGHTALFDWSAPAQYAAALTVLQWSAIGAVAVGLTVVYRRRTRVLHIASDGAPLCGVVVGDARLPEGHGFVSIESAARARALGRLTDAGLCPGCVHRLV